MLRFICVASFVILFLVFSIPLLIAEWIIGFFNKDLKDKSSLAIVNWAFRCLRIAQANGADAVLIGETLMRSDNIPETLYKLREGTA